MMINGLVRNWMSSPVVTVAPDTRLSDARRIMDAERIRSLPVVKGTELVGIVTRRGLLKADLSSLDAEAWRKNVEELREERISEIMTTNVITIAPSSPLPRAARIMMENKITALPVVDKEAGLVGIVTPSDIFRALLAELPALKENIPARDYMSSQIVSVTPDTSLLEAHRLMGVKRIRTLPVLVGDEMKGILTRTDLLSADPPRVYSANQQEASMQIELSDVERVMTKNVISIFDDTSVLDAAKILLDNKFHSLPVFDHEGKLCGILTETDLFRLMVQKFL